MALIGRYVRVIRSHLTLKADCIIEVKARLAATGQADFRGKILWAGGGPYSVGTNVQFISSDTDLIGPFHVPAGKNGCVHDGKQGPYHGNAYHLRGCNIAGCGTCGVSWRKGVTRPGLYQACRYGGNFGVQCWYQKAWEDWKLSAPVNPTNTTEDEEIEWGALYTFVGDGDKIGPIGMTFRPTSYAAEGKDKTRIEGKIESIDYEDEKVKRFYAHFKVGSTIVFYTAFIKKVGEERTSKLKQQLCYCGSPGYIGLFLIECTNASCRYYKPKRTEAP